MSIGWFFNIIFINIIFIIGILLAAIEILAHGGKSK